MADGFSGWGDEAPTSGTAEITDLDPSKGGGCMAGGFGW